MFFSRAATLFLAPVLLWFVSLPAYSAKDAVTIIAAKSEPRIELTDAERQYIREAAPITVGVAGDTPPLYTAEPDGRIIGIVGDYLDLIGERTGLKFIARDKTTFKQLLAAAEANEIDVMPLFALDPSRLPNFAQSRVYITLPIAYIARRGLEDVTPNNNFEGYRVAAISSTATENYLKNVMPSAKIQSYDDGAAALKAVSFGEADVFVGPLQLALYQIDKLLLLNLDLRGELNVDFGAYRMAISKKNPRLASIMQKAFNSIAPDEDIAIRNRWSPAQALLKPHYGKAALTEAEREWVNKNRELRVAYDREFVPFSFQDKGGAMAGLAADYLKLAEAKTGLKVVNTAANTWANALADVREGRANLLVASARNEERRTYLSFIGPYAGVPTAIVGRLDEKEVTAIEDLAFAKIALIRSHFLIPEFRRRYPAMTIVEVDSQRQALEMVEDRSVRAAIGNLNVIDPILQRNFLGALRVINTVPGGDSELFFAVPQNKPELARVLRKGLDSVTAQESAHLRQKWLNVTYQSGVPWRTVLQIGLPIAFAALSILLATLWWNRKLKREVALRTLAEARTAEALQAAQAMSEAKTKFLATMSHEIRGPVAGIIGMADSMLRRIELPEEKNRLKMIRDSGEHLVRLLSHVLDYTKAEAGAFTPVEEWTSLVALVEESINPFRYVSEQKRLDIGLVVRGELAANHFVDPMRLRQIISNLFSNAVKFTDNGRVDVLLAAESVKDGRQVVYIRVQDTGPGIPLKDRDRLFMPYGQTDLGRKRSDSTGLGLSISKAIVERLGGTLRLLNDNEREVAGGACFEIALNPAAREHVSSPPQPHAMHATTNSPSQAAAATTSTRVLLADDDALNLALHREVLEGAGFVVDTATNGEEAWRLWQRDRHTLIFSDGSMPVMSGLDFVKAVRADTGSFLQPWFVVLTSYLSALDRDDYLRAGVDDLIEKPLLPRGVQEALARRDRGQRG